MNAPEPDEIRVRDAETVLSDVQKGCEALGIPVPPPEVERQMVDALDYFAAQAARSYPIERPVRGAVIAFVCGVASAVRGDGFGEWWRWPTEAQRRWWDHGYDWTHTLTGYRLNRWTCTFCGHRVAAAPSAAHATECSQWSPPAPVAVWRWMRFWMRGLS